MSLSDPPPPNTPPAGGSGILAPGWAAAVRRARQDRAAEEPVAVPVIPRNPSSYTVLTIVSTTAEMTNVIEFVRQRDVTVVGLAVASVAPNATPAVRADTDREVIGPDDSNPFFLALALYEPAGSGFEVYPIVVNSDCECFEFTLKELLALPAAFAAYDSAPVLLALWSRGLSEPDNLWDVRVAESAFALGLHHPRYTNAPGHDPQTARRRAEECREAELTPGTIALKYGVHVSVYPTAPPADRAVALATLAARAYPPQAAEAARRGCLHHLIATEMPWVVTTARATGSGVRLDQSRCTAAAEAAERHVTELGKRLAEHGIADPTDDGELRLFFERAGVLDLFRHHDGFAFDGDRLDAAAGRHPAIPLVRAARRARDLAAGRVLTGAFTGPDGRVHPRYRVLGAHSGRLTCRDPNVMGVGKVFRPLVVPDPGNGIGEVDYCQIEVGIAAAVYRDERLIEMFNRGDVYAAMAQTAFANELDPADRTLQPAAFRNKRPDLRDRMKACTLGVIYGLGPRGLALRLGVSEPRASAFLAAFFELFPALRRALEAGPQYTAIRGCVADVSGLRRRRPVTGPLSVWERNWARNHPVQGAAAAVFKDAGNRLDRLYRGSDTRLLVPLHDAFVFEAPLERLAEAADLTARVMIDAVRARFPELRPRVSVNVAHPARWNKDGRADSVEEWIRDPFFTL